MKGLSIGGQKKSEGVELNMSPLIDMVFILLIFFLVTTSFVQQAGGPKIEEPIATTAKNQSNINMVVSVTKGGIIYIDRRAVDLQSVRSVMEKYYHQHPLGNVVITADKDCKFSIAIDVLDNIREAGITHVTVAASKE